MELKEFRKILKPLGFKVQTRSNSFGRCGTIVKDGVDMPSIFYDETGVYSLRYWQGAIDLKPVEGVYDGNEVIYGLKR